MRKIPEPKKLGVPDLNETARKLLDAIKTKPDIVPEGWVTIGQVQKYLRISKSHATTIVHHHSDGERVFNIKTGNGGITGVRHYLLKKAL